MGTVTAIRMAAPSQASATWDVDDLRVAFEHHYPFVRRSAARLGVAPAHLDDAAQDAFVVLIRRADSFGPCRSVRALLFAIVRRVARDYRRRAGPKFEPPAVPLKCRGPHARVEAAQLVARFLAELTPPNREVFILAELEGMSAPEICDALGGVNLNTVYSRLRSARLRLRALVNDKERLP